MDKLLESHITLELFVQSPHDEVHVFSRDVDFVLVQELLKHFFVNEVLFLCI